MKWEFKLPVKIVFGCGELNNLYNQIADFDGKGVLVSSKTLERNGIADKIVKNSNGKIVTVFSDIQPNPTIQNTNECVSILRNINASFTVALGGGSVIDCCKAASAIARGDGFISDYYSQKCTFNENEAIPMIAIPTTSGTASEVTNISVLTDPIRDTKEPINNDVMYSKVAIVDPELTLTVPPHVTASTGLDVLCHAVESYWSTLSQPICRACSIHSAKLVFKWLETAYNNPDDIEAREKMSEASIIAGVAFSHPRTTASHACSFPLTNIYHVPHGEACAMTLDYFIRYNAKNWKSSLLFDLAKECGFNTPEDMADEIYNMKKRMNMTTSLTEIGCTTDDEIRKLTKESMSMLIKRNPVPLDEQDIYNTYLSIR